MSIIPPRPYVDLGGYQSSVQVDFNDPGNGVIAQPSNLDSVIDMSHSSFFSPSFVPRVVTMYYSCDTIRPKST